MEPTPIDYTDLAPYRTWCHYDEAGEAEWQLPAGILRTTVDDVEYVSDRFVVLRASLLAGEPHALQSVQHLSTPKLAESIRAALTVHPEGEQTPGIAPYWVDFAQRAGLTLVPSNGKQWLMRDMFGNVVGTVNGMAEHRHSDETMPVLPPFTPDSDLEPLRAILPHFTDVVDKNEAWSRAYAVTHQLAS